MWLLSFVDAVCWRCCCLLFVVIVVCRCWSSLAAAVVCCWCHVLLDVAGVLLCRVLVLLSSFFNYICFTLFVVGLRVFSVVGVAIALVCC